MNISVDEMIDLNNRIRKGMKESGDKGRKEALAMEHPDTLFEAILEYGNRTKTLINYERSSDLNWIQIKPTRTDANKVQAVEISFCENRLTIEHIGVCKKV